VIAWQAQLDAGAGPYRAHYCHRATLLP
jgi:hypothetical protein